MPRGSSVFATRTVEENLALSFRRSRGRGGVRSGLDQASWVGSGAEAADRVTTQLFAAPAT
jgi:hypothetical protein